MRELSAQNFQARRLDIGALISMTGILDHDPSNAALAKGPAEKADALSRPAGENDSVGSCNRRACAAPGERRSRA